MCVSQGPYYEGSHFVPAGGAGGSVRSFQNPNNITTVALHRSPPSQQQGWGSGKSDTVENETTTGQAGSISSTQQQQPRTQCIISTVSYFLFQFIMYV